MEADHEAVPLNLAEIDAAAWRELETAAASPQSGFRFLNLCSVDSGARPQARMVVLRRADGPSRVLEFHTDSRSPKWLELSANPHVTILGFSTQTRLQFRLQGTVELHAPGSDQANAAWDKLSTWTRTTYTGGLPGDECAFDVIDHAVPPKPADEAKGKPHFGLLIFRARMLDWFELRRQGNRRALLIYDQAGALAACRWVNP
ncbi:MULTISPECIES: pyridoxamine 5'-phosphate oxidase family protein [unclassified Rhizobium]|uniref:pyridoxamine 5'-phosphate oxidase family protein n=1 Tax=unclassified Rhizobium TaxID=2613769 RepID=UPI000B30D87A|nr:MULTISPECIES: pyridoxamine 5'-phosphate oxidase family protein [unclassified Rhizobium]